jgi:hypothetical protein
MNVRYELGSTASGWAVYRRDGSYAEFLSRGEAEAALENLASSDDAEADYDWQESC